MAVPAFFHMWKSVTPHLLDVTKSNVAWPRGRRQTLDALATAL